MSVIAVMMATIANKLLFPSQEIAALALAMTVGEELMCAYGWISPLAVILSLRTSILCLRISILPNGSDIARFAWFVRLRLFNE